MTHRAKVLGLTLIAILATSAIAASSASATDVFTSTKSVETISGTATNGVIEITGPELSATCATVNLHAVVQNGASEGTGSASLEGTAGSTDSGHCGSDLGTGDVVVNECQIIITGNTIGGHARAWVTCPSGKEIELRASEIGVTIKIPAQTPTSGGLTYTNEAGGKVKAEATVEGITYTCQPKLACNLGVGSTEGNTADLTGSILMAGAQGAIAYSEQ